MLACGLSYEPRPQQVRMAQAIATAFTERRHACIEAPTGVGKTFAYLVPAIFFAQETKRPVVVSTHTINLQEQICKKDLPLLGKLLKQEISYAVAKGRNNYLCLRRLSQIADMDQALLPGEISWVKLAPCWTGLKEPAAAITARWTALSRRHCGRQSAANAGTAWPHNAHSSSVAS